MPKADSAAPHRKNDPQGLRSRVLDAAAQLFQQQGYGGATMQEIAVAADVTPGALHHHFPTKKALGVAVIRERVAEAVLEAWITPLSRAASCVEGVQAVFAEIAEGLEAQGSVRGCPLNNLALELAFGDAEFRGELRLVFDAWRQALADQLRADQAAGRLEAWDPESFATFVVAAFSGAMTLAKTEQSARPLRLAASRVLAALGA